MVVTVLAVTNLMNSRDGRAITATRDNDIAAESIGIPVSYYKVKPSCSPPSSLAWRE